MPILDRLLRQGRRPLSTDYRVERTPLRRPKQMFVWSFPSSSRHEVQMSTTSSPRSGHRSWDVPGAGRTSRTLSPSRGYSPVSAPRPRTTFWRRRMDSTAKWRTSTGHGSTDPEGLVSYKKQQTARCSPSKRQRISSSGRPPRCGP